jgi:hypothetical protein
MNRTFLALVGGGLVFLALWAIGGGFALAHQRVNIDTAKGQVWNQVDAGAQKIHLLESQVLGAYNQQNAVVAQIVEGRKGMESARQAGDIQAATAAAQSALSGLTILVEANPVSNLTPIQIGLMDETAGVLNRISYARDNLIQEQQTYNQQRITFFVISWAFPSEQILGSTANPAQQLPPSLFETPTK